MSSLSRHDRVIFIHSQPRTIEQSLLTVKVRGRIWCAGCPAQAGFAWVGTLRIAAAPSLPSAFCEASMGSTLTPLAPPRPLIRTLPDHPRRSSQQMPRLPIPFILLPLPSRSNVKAEIPSGFLKRQDVPRIRCGTCGQFCKGGRQQRRNFSPEPQMHGSFLPIPRVEHNSKSIFSLRARQNRVLVSDRRESPQTAGTGVTRALSVISVSSRSRAL